MTTIRPEVDPPGARGLLLAASRDPDAKLTFLVTEPDEGGGTQRLAVKIPATARAGDAVDVEGRMLVGLRRAGLGALAATVPRYVRSVRVDGLPVLVSTALPGTPMSVGYHAWHHTAHRRSVQRDFRLVSRWLHELQLVTAQDGGRLSWPAEVLDMVHGRWDGHPRLAEAVSRLQVAEAHLADRQVAATTVHGDFWFGNVLVQDGQVSGVVDWEHGARTGCPLRDPARFALSYSLYLDRHVAPGRPVAGHPGLRRTGFGAGIGHGLLGAGWYPDTVRRFLGDSLGRLGLSRGLWYDVALLGLGEIAATANDDTFGSDHLELLAALPLHPRRSP